MSAIWILIECLTIGTCGVALGFLLGARFQERRMLIRFAQGLSREILAGRVRRESDRPQLRAVRGGKR